MQLHYKTTNLTNALENVEPTLYLYMLDTTEREAVTNYLEDLYTTEGFTPDQVIDAITNAHDEQLYNLPIHYGY